MNKFWKWVNHQPLYIRVPLTIPIVLLYGKVLVDSGKGAVILYKEVKNSIANHFKK